jgi:murein L,D-transpeptidase YafK
LDETGASEPWEEGDPTWEEAAQMQAGQAAEDEAKSDREKLLSLLSAWIKAWKDRDQEAYFGLYAEDFRLEEKNMSFQAFRKYRGRLMTEAKILEVSAENPEAVISPGDQKGQVSFTQSYKSDTINDRGTKILYFRKRDGNWKIIGETWRALP